MLNRQQCSASNPCSNYGGLDNGCLTNLQNGQVGSNKYSLVSEAGDALEKMYEDMPENVKKDLKISDSYRALKIQCNIFNFDVFEKTGKRIKIGTASTPVAKPGTSNHGWGRALDLSSKTAQSWIKDNGSKYGWCWGEAPSEPWHFTFCGPGSNKSSLCSSICKGGVEIQPTSKTKDSIPKPLSSVGLTQSYYSGKAAENIKMIISKLKQKGITNPMVQATILATIGKESAFIPQNEIGYGSTPNASIRSTFSSTKKLSDSELNILKSSDKDFFNYVYGPKGAGPGLGNTSPEDGYKYRGRGFNQITGRGNYAKFGYDGNPDELNNPDGAADAMINFLAREGSALNNRFNSQDDALEFFVTRNAGGRKTSKGESKAREVLSKFKVGTVEGGTDSSDTELATDISTEPGTEEKNVADTVDKFKDFKDLFNVLSGRNKLTIKEESDRIKDIIKKVL